MPHSEHHRAHCHTDQQVEIVLLKLQYPSTLSTVTGGGAVVVVVVVVEVVVVVVGVVAVVEVVKVLVDAFSELNLHN